MQEDFYVRQSDDGVCPKCGKSTYKGDWYRTNTTRGQELAEVLCTFCAQEREKLEDWCHNLIYEARCLLDDFLELPIEASEEDIYTQADVGLYNVYRAVRHIEELANIRNGYGGE